MLSIVTATRSSAGRSAKRTNRAPRMARACLVLVTAGAALTACSFGPGGVPPDPACVEQCTVTVSGYVRYADGAPYAGATVLFRNVYGDELHTDTDSNGWYQISLPPDSYSPFAVDNRSVVNAGFDVVGGSVVRVPPSVEVDFVATPVVQY